MTNWSHLNPDDTALLAAHGGERVVAISPSMVRALKGNGNAAILMGQFLYWSRKSEDDGGWFHNTQTRLEEQTGLCDDAQLTARRCLKKHDLIEEKTVGIPAKLWVRVNLERLAELIRTHGTRDSSRDARKLASEPEEVPAMPGNLSTVTPETSVRQPRKLLEGTETTTEITSETTSLVHLASLDGEIQQPKATQLTSLEECEAAITQSKAPKAQPSAGQKAEGSTIPRASQMCLPAMIDPLAIYRAYPKPKERGYALRAIGKAIEKLNQWKRQQPDDPTLSRWLAYDGDASQFLMEAVLEFAKSDAGQKGNFTPGPAPWFNKERYLDDRDTWQDRDAPRISEQTRIRRQLREEERALIEQSERYGYEQTSGHNTQNSARELPGGFAALA